MPCTERQWQSKKKVEVIYSRIEGKQISSRVDFQIRGGGGNESELWEVLAKRSTKPKWATQNWDKSNSCSTAAQRQSPKRSILYISEKWTKCQWHSNEDQLKVPPKQKKDQNWRSFQPRKRWLPKRHNTERRRNRRRNGPRIDWMGRWRSNNAK